MEHTKKIFKKESFEHRRDLRSGSDGFRLFIVRLCTKDSSRFVGFRKEVESFENWVPNQNHRTNLFSTVVRNESTKQTFWTPEGQFAFYGYKVTGYESGFANQIHGFARWIHWLRNLLYEPRNLRISTWVSQYFMAVVIAISTKTCYFWLI